MESDPVPDEPQSVSTSHRLLFLGLGEHTTPWKVGSDNSAPANARENGNYPKSFSASVLRAPVFSLAVHRNPALALPGN